MSVFTAAELKQASAIANQADQLMANPYLYNMDYRNMDPTPPLLAPENPVQDTLGNAAFNTMYGMGTYTTRPFRALTGWGSSGPSIAGNVLSGAGSLLGAGVLGLTGDTQGAQQAWNSGVGTLKHSWMPWNDISRNDHAGVNATALGTHIGKNYGALMTPLHSFKQWATAPRAVSNDPKAPKF